MKLTVLGASPSYPNAGSASSGYLIRQGETAILLECGHGIAGVLPTVIDPSRLTAIVISHMHADHFLDLVPLAYGFRFQYQRAAPIPLWLPPGGIDILLGVADALGLSETFWDEAYHLSEYDPTRTLALSELQVRFQPTRHFIDAWAMRFQTNNERQLAFSSDTGAGEEIAEFLRGAPLALIEATQATYDSVDEALGHLTGALAGKIAKEANVGRLLLIHYPQSLASDLLDQATANFGRPAELAVPGTTYEV